MNIVELNQISVNYGGIQALDKVSVVFAEREIVAILGPNGAGKSTLLKAFFGLVPLSSGNVTLYGNSFTPVAHTAVEQGISYVPQGRRVFARLTVGENLEVGGWLIRDSKERQKRINEIVSLFPILGQKLKTRAGLLSGGQQQMLALARGLMTKPRLLLLDEPSLGLAPNVISQVFSKIGEVNREYKTTVVIVEHNIRSVLAVASRGYVLNMGSVVFEGTSKEIMKGKILEKVISGGVNTV